MSPQPSDFKSVNEIGKVYASLTEKKALCDFFPLSVSMFIPAEEGYLYLSGVKGDLWLNAGVPAQSPPEGLLEAARRMLAVGKPALEGGRLWVPLVVRNQALGIACFLTSGNGTVFSRADLDVAFDLASQMAGALQNTLLFEKNLEMEKLATIGQSMSMVLHEIKNIMQLATFAEESLVRGIEEDSKTQLNRGIEGIQKALAEMNGFIYEVLSLTKSYSIRPAKTDLNKMMTELEKNLSEKAGAYEVALQFQVEDGFAEVDAEERSLYRALLNLIKNAMEACDKDESWIRTSVRSLDDETYEIRIQDNGQGMSDEVKAKLFEAFFSTKGEKGTGLGLMIVQKTIQAHYGRLDVQSRPGEGTSFILTLPKTIRPLPEEAGSR